MRGYVALSGREGAFGWSKETAAGAFLTALGGLGRQETYTLSDGGSITTDDRGNWQGVRPEALRFVACCGRVILCDENQLSWEEAALLAQPKAEKPMPQQVQPAEKPVRVPEKQSIVYRARLHDAPVDALPAVHWPRGCEKLRAMLAQEKPVRVLPFPWRFAAVPGTNAQQLAGCLLENGCITKTAFAVRAKGGLLQPKGLHGYDYVRTDTGENYWMLIQNVK